MESGRSKKKKFLLSTDKPAYQMSAMDIDKMIHYYKERYDIDIIKNGTTEKFKDIVVANNQPRLKMFDEELDAVAGIDNQDIKLISYFKYCASAMNSGTTIPTFRFGRYNIFNDDHPLQKYVNQFEKLMGCDRQSLPDNLDRLTNDEIKRLNAQLQTKALELEILDELNHHAKGMRDELYGFMYNKGLENHDCVSEIREICESLKENEYRGYFYTDGAQNDIRHFEVLLLSHDKIIKPIHWPFANKSTTWISKEMLPDMFFPELDESIFTKKPATDKDTDIHICPQAGSVECGTLGLACLKELLRDDAKQITNNTLTINYYSDGSDEMKHLFFPSPDILRYSQSGLYNSIIAAMVSDDPIVTIKARGSSFEVNSLRTILERSIKIADEKQNKTVSDQNKTILERLPEFCENWNKQYHEANKKRKTMDVEVKGDDKLINHYLLFKTNRVRDIVQATESQQKNTSTNKKKRN